MHPPAHSPRTQAAPAGENALSNEDLLPTTAAQRSWRWYHFAALWIGMVMCIPCYMLAAGLLEQGMSAPQAVMTVFLGNLIILGPMLLVGHAGARYGIPFPVMARAAFGVHGAKLPALLRAIVACGWFGIQTWVGGNTLHTLVEVALGTRLPSTPVLGTTVSLLACFVVFWLVQLAFVQKGIELIRRLETWTAPLKIVICVVLVGWALDRAGGLGPIVSAPSAFAPGGAKAGQFWAVFWPALTAMVGFWGTLSLNIPDFTRFARSQSDQIIGQAVGLPAPMGLLALVSVIVTSATVVIYGKAIWDPVALAGNFSGVAVLVALLVISIDTVSCNLAANLVGPAYDFSALAPRHVSYRTGAYITAVIGALVLPWNLLASTQGYIFVWLVGYSALLGPVVGVLIADYWIVRRGELVVADLYRAQGCYAYRKGWNPVAIVAFVAGVLPNVPGFLHAAVPAVFSDPGVFWRTVYTYAWFVGAAIAVAVYVGATAARQRGTPVPPAPLRNA